MTSGTLFYFNQHWFLIRTSVADFCFISMFRKQFPDSYTMSFEKVVAIFAVLLTLVQSVTGLSFTRQAVKPGF